MAKEDEYLSYAKAGVDYRPIDWMKRYGLLKARETRGNLEKFGFKEIETTRGESAYVFEMGSFLGAITIEGLGTKNLVAEKWIDGGEMEYWHYLAWDCVACIVNDLVTVGAQPVVVSPHWAAGSSEWFKKENCWRGLVDGWTAACREAGAVYAAGETAALPGLINAGSIELSGSGFGVISPKERLCLGEKLDTGDEIILVESNGIHANGLSLARIIIEEDLPSGYETKLADRTALAKALLKPSRLYAKLQQKVFESGIEIHYMVNITGHGWRKLMRANRELSYRIIRLPPVPEELAFLGKAGEIGDAELYTVFNMGAGFAFMVSRGEGERVVEEAKQLGLTAMVAGVVEAGNRQVIIEPLGSCYDHTGD